MKQVKFDYSPIKFTIPKSEIVLDIIKIPNKQKNRITNEWEELEPKPYMQVAQRLVWFNHDKPEWIIETALEEEKEITTYYNDKPQKSLLIRYICYIKDPEGKIKRTARKSQKVGSALDYDKCETGAIGRALALMGYGTQYATSDLDDETEVIDAPTSVNKTLTDQKPKPQAPKQEPSMLSDIQVLSQMKFTGGLYATQTFEQTFAIETKANHEWARKYAVKAKAKEPIPVIISDYLKYVEALGVKL